MDFLDFELFSVGEYAFELNQLISIILISIFGITVFRWLRFYLNPRIKSWETVTDQQRRKLLRIIKLFFVFLGLLAVILILNLNYNLSPNDENPINISFILEAIAIIQFARRLDWIVSNYFIHRNFVKRDEKKEPGKKRDPEGIATKTVQYLVYLIALVLIVKNLNLDYVLTTIQLKGGQEFQLRISNIF